MHLSLMNLATWFGLSSDAFNQALKLRTDCLQELSQGSAIDVDEMYDAINELRHQKQPTIIRK